MIRNAVRRFLNRRRRCVCGRYAMPGIGAYTTQVGGVLHRVDGPCFVCDGYGRPAGSSGTETSVEGCPADTRGDR
jgi:hypothetical protein